MILADKIILLRKKCGWSQEELAEKLNVTRQSVSKWEGAQSVPDLDKILKISQIFGVTTDYLLKDDMEECVVKETSVEAAVEHGETLQAVNVRYNIVAIILCILLPIFLLISYISYYKSDIAFWPGGATAVFLVVITIAVILFVRGGKGAEQYAKSEGSMRRSRIAFEIMRIGLMAVLFGSLIFLYATVTFETLDFPEEFYGIEGAATIIYELRVYASSLPSKCVTVSFLIYKICNITALCFYVRDNTAISMRKLFLYNVGTMVLIMVPVIIIVVLGINASGGYFPRIEQAYFQTLGHYIWNDVLAFMLIDAVILFIRYFRMKHPKE